MKPILKELQAQLPDIGKKLIENHLNRLDDSYFKLFKLPEVISHIHIISKLSPENPVEVIVNVGQSDNFTIDCTVVAFDYPAEFSLITGILAGMGFSVISGNIFTYRRLSSAISQKKKRGHWRKKTTKKNDRRYIIDHFSGNIDSMVQLDMWTSELKRNLNEVILLLEKGGNDAQFQARQMVNEMVTSYLTSFRDSRISVLYPVELNIDNSNSNFTRLKVISQDTPAFLYSLSNSLALQGLSIEHVRIRTILGKVEDIVDIVDTSGNPVTNSKTIDHLKLSVLLTKQFTYYLDRAPDPYTALLRFEQLVDELNKMPEKDRLITMLADPKTMKELATVLGTSDFLWEDFIRLQYENLLPLLQTHAFTKTLDRSVKSMGKRLDDEIEKGKTYEEKKLLLNEFKNHEFFVTDLQHILSSDKDIRILAEKLTSIAESIVSTASRIVYERLVQRYGIPRTVAGLETAFSIFGLGKLGGAALGYASDIELLFIYSDNGETDGENSINNGEFFSLLVSDITTFIESKRQGIFDIDLRLRPYGNSGPQGVSLESFCRYYGPGGAAHSYEKLALVRLRAIGGDDELGKRVERLRDEFIYTSTSIKLDELRELREKQFQEKTRINSYNAKFNPGALVDIEYTVQILQVMSGAENPALRTPLIHLALKELKNSGILTEEEQDQLNKAYDFLRVLINGLRMLRGSAKDLFLPPVYSPEFVHLARRTGYTDRGELSSAKQLFVDLETHTAIVRAFVERHLGRESLPGPIIGNVADLIVVEPSSSELRDNILKANRFENPERAYANIRKMAGDGERRELFTKLAVLAFDMLRHEPDPDMALNNWERFTQILPSSEEHFEMLFSQPKRFQILLELFSRSQFLSDTLIKNPEYLNGITSQEVLYKNHTCKTIIAEMNTWSGSCESHEDWLRVMRSFRRREILRIGTRDICLKLSLPIITKDLSTLADAIINVALENIIDDVTSENPKISKWELKNRFSILAFGKLGGDELNYSSDIDLLGIFDDDGLEAKDGSDSSLNARVFNQIMERLNSDLSTHTDEGYVYRVDLRLRPYGRTGNLVSSVKTVIEYYKHNASQWEYQALLKLRPAAGNLTLGKKLIQSVIPLLYNSNSREIVVKTIHDLRQGAIKKQSLKNLSSTNVKTGEGGIRDIEFLVQGLQLINLEKYPELFTGNTLKALDVLGEKNIIKSEDVTQLREDYIFLRRIEHYLQILEDQQIHVLPRDSVELNALAKRVLGINADNTQFMIQLNACLERVHIFFQDYLNYEKN